MTQTEQDIATLDPRTPVIVGVGQRLQRPDDLETAVEACVLMQEAVEVAAADASAPALLDDLELVAVVSGAWRYADPGRLIADAVGTNGASTMLTHNGGNTPQSLMNELCRRIQHGALRTATIVGGETIWSRRRQRAAGMSRRPTTQEGVEPDERFRSDIPMSTEFEQSRGLEMPVQYYPIFESAVRAANGESIAAHRDRIADLWEGFNAVASQNPYAWSRRRMTADQIREPENGNRMVGFPYTKAMNSNWDLDQAAALLVCSVEAALDAGVPPDRWVFPLAGTDAHDTLAVSERRDLHSSPAISAAGERLFALAGITVHDVDHVDLYSCFPSAVQVGAAALGISLDRRLTVTGGLTFAGGPLNNYVTHSIATMVQTLRADPGSIGLVTANGGYLTKHALGLYSTAPPSRPFRTEDVQPAVDAIPKTAVVEDHVGPATIEAYTVMHGKEGPERTLAALRVGDGARTWASSTDPTTMASLMDQEGVGRAVDVDAEGHFLLV